MQSTVLRWTTICVAGALTLVAPISLQAQLPTRAHLKLMNDAMPTRAQATPKKPRRILVFTRTQGFVHSSIPYGAKAMELLGEKTGAFTAVVSDDPEMFREDILQHFDGVVMVNTTREVFLPPAFDDLPAALQNPIARRDSELKRSFLTFIESGGGLIGIHAATDCFYEWPDYGAMIGGYFTSHPWTKNVTVGVKLDEPDHPLNRAFKGQGFMITDEIYQFREEPYSRKKQRVLLSLDTGKTDMTSERIKRSIKRTDGDFAISWIKRHGQGRVFYCSLGHNENIYWNTAVLQHYLDGIQYALGDLEAPDTPSK